MEWHNLWATIESVKIESFVEVDFSIAYCVKIGGVLSISHIYIYIYIEREREREREKEHWDLGL